MKGYFKVVARLGRMLAIAVLTGGALTATAVETRSDAMAEADDGLQTNFAVHAGVNFMNANIASESNQDTGYLLGGAMNVPLLSDFLRLQGELNLTRVGAQNSAFGGGTTRFTYLEVPLMLRPQVNLGGVELFGLIGPKLSILVDTSENVAADARRGYEAGAYAGAGIGLNAFDFANVFVMGRYTLGLTDIDQSPTEWNSEGFQILAGLVLRP